MAVPDQHGAVTTLLWATLAGYGFFPVWWLVDTTMRSRGRDRTSSDDYVVVPFDG